MSAARAKQAAALAAINCLQVSFASCERVCAKARRTFAKSFKSLVRTLEKQAGEPDRRRWTEADRPACKCNSGVRPTRCLEVGCKATATEICHCPLNPKPTLKTRCKCKCIICTGSCRKPAVSFAPLATPPINVCGGETGQCEVCISGGQCEAASFAVASSYFIQD